MQSIMCRRPVCVYVFFSLLYYGVCYAYVMYECIFDWFSSFPVIFAYFGRKLRILYVFGVIRSILVCVHFRSQLRVFRFATDFFSLYTYKCMQQFAYMCMHEFKRNHFLPQPCKQHIESSDQTFLQFFLTLLWQSFLLSFLSFFWLTPH